jgi:hypothetical protein
MARSITAHRHSQSARQHLQPVPRYRLTVEWTARRERKSTARGVAMPFQVPTSALSRLSSSHCDWPSFGTSSHPPYAASKQSPTPQQLLHIAERQVEPQVPPDRDHDHLRWEPEPGKRGPRRRPGEDESETSQLKPALIMRSANATDPPRIRTRCMTRTDEVSAPVTANRQGSSRIATRSTSADGATAAT